MQAFVREVRSQSNPDHPHHLILVDLKNSDIMVINNFRFWLRSKQILYIDVIVLGD